MVTSTRGSSIKESAMEVGFTIISRAPNMRVTGWTEGTTGMGSRAGQEVVATEDSIGRD